MLTEEEAVAFVREHGVVLMSAKGPVPRLVEAIAGEPIKGSWWAHSRSHAIYRVLQAIENSPDILICRLIDPKITCVHRRLWAALVKNADAFSPAQLAQVRQEHTASGRHTNRTIDYPDWVPEDVRKAARRLSKEEAARLLPPTLTRSAPRSKKYSDISKTRS
jgi:hypothetical protein